MPTLYNHPFSKWYLHPINGRRTWLFSQYSHTVNQILAILPLKYLLRQLTSFANPTISVLAKISIISYINKYLYHPSSSYSKFSASLLLKTRPWTNPIISILCEAFYVMYCYWGKKSTTWTGTTRFVFLNLKWNFSNVQEYLCLYSPLAPIPHSKLICTAIILTRWVSIQQMAILHLPQKNRLWEAVSS